MEVLVLVLVAVGALGGGVWWTQHRSTTGGGDDGEVFRVEGVSDKIRALTEEQRHLKIWFLAVAGLNVVLLGATGLLTVSGHIDGPSVWLLAAGMLFGALPAGALLGIGHSLPGLFATPSVPAHLKAAAASDGGEPLVKVSRTGPLWLAVGVGLVSLVGSGLFALQHMMEATEQLGFTTPVFGLSPAVLVPACIEFFQGFLLGAIMVKGIDLANLKAEAGQVRRAELEHDIAQQRLEAELASQRLAAEAEYAKAKATAGAQQREIEQFSALEAAKRDASQATLVATAKRQAEAEAEIIELRAAADLARIKAECEMQLVADNKRLEIKFEIDQLRLDQQLIEEKQQVLALQASNAAAGTMDLAPKALTPNGATPDDLHANGNGVKR